MTEREIKAGADALFNIAMAHGYRLNDVEAREGSRAVLRAAKHSLRAPDVLRALVNYAPSPDAEIPIWLVFYLQNALDEASGGDGEQTQSVKEE